MNTSQTRNHTTDTESNDTPTIMLCDPSPEKTVFIEENNTDGWIATSLTTVVTQ